MSVPTPSPRLSLMAGGVSSPPWSGRFPGSAAQTPTGWPRRSGLAQEIGSAIQSLCAGLADDLSGEVSGAAALVVGVSVPGVVDEDEGRVRRSETLGLEDAPLASLVRRSLSSQASGSPGLSGGLEVRLYQDAGCGAWAESQWGAAGRNCLYLAVGERISSAVLLGGAPVLGEGWAGQVGRILVPDPDWSGERARLEDVASVCAMVRRHTAGMLDDSAAPEPGGCEDASDESFAQCATGLESLLGAIASGDREARRVWDTGLDCLAELIAQGVGLLGPLDVVVNSELMRAARGDRAGAGGGGARTGRLEVA